MIKKVCENCGKGVLKGHKVSHAKQRTRKFSKPNLQTAKIMVNGVRKRMVLCTKCLKTLKKEKAKKLYQPADKKEKAPKKTSK